MPPHSGVVGRIYNLKPRRVFNYIYFFVVFALLWPSVSLVFFFCVVGKTAAGALSPPPVS